MMKTVFTDFNSVHNSAAASERKKKIAHNPHSSLSAASVALHKAAASVVFLSSAASVALL